MKVRSAELTAVFVFGFPAIDIEIIQAISKRFPL